VTGTIFDQLDDIALTQLAGLEDTFVRLKMDPFKYQDDYRFWTRFREVIQDYEKHYNQKWKDEE